MMYDRVLVPLLFGGRGDTLFKIGKQMAQIACPVVRVVPSMVHRHLMDMSTLFVTEVLPPELYCDVLLPRGAKSLKFVQGHNIFVPFGSGRSGVRAARNAVSLAKALGLSVVFYHTAWRRPEIKSEDPFVHMTKEAMAVGEEMRALAQHECVEYRTVIETADTVMAGVMRRALLERAALMVLIHGDEVRKGSYVDRLAKVSPVPLLVLKKGVGS